MAILTIIFVALCLAAWKAPAWVKELGRLALVFGIFGMLLGIQQICGAIQMASDNIPVSVLCGGIKVVLIPVLYGIIIYFISLIISIAQKPRI